VIANRGNIEIVFRLEATRLFYYFSLEIRLSGELGEKATSDPFYRDLGVATIAKCLDPNYELLLKKPQTTDELRNVLERNKKDLLNYCGRILLGDVSIWEIVVQCVKEEGKNLDMAINDGRSILLSGKITQP
jgi:hypothetical protein